MTSEPTPIHDQVLAELGPIGGPVDTDYEVLVAEAVLGLCAKATPAT